LTRRDTAALCAEHLVLADVGAVNAIAARRALEQPPAALRSRTAHELDAAGDLFGEALPDGIDQPQRAIAMPKHLKRRAPKPASAPPTDTLHVLMEQHLVWMQTHNFSEDTVNTRRSCIGYFIDWCHERALNDPIEITRPILERYSIRDARQFGAEPAERSDL
jgi:hypothetical protein